nr:MAG TPA: hypothetical protein [Caudoviricetes sp.]
MSGQCGSSYCCRSALAFQSLRQLHAGLGCAGFPVHPSAQRERLPRYDFV